MSDHPIDRMAVATDDTTEFQRTAEIRDAALKAYIKNKSQEAIKKAYKARPRAAVKYEFKAGDIVYVWRNKVTRERQYRGWVGPGLIVCINDKQTSAYVSMRGVLVKNQYGTYETRYRS